MMYLADANTLSEPAKARPNEALLDRIVRHRGEIATAAPVLFELLRGIYRLPVSRRRHGIERYIDESVRAMLPILPYDAVAAEWHVSEHVRLELIGRTPPFVDGQIAAIAATNGLVLVTSNTADFQHFQGLRLEDWRL